MLTRLGFAIGNGLKFERRWSNVCMTMRLRLPWLSFPAALTLAFAGCGDAANHAADGDLPFTVSPSEDPVGSPDGGLGGDNAASRVGDEASVDYALYLGPDGGIASIAGMLAGFS